MYFAQDQKARTETGTPQEWLQPKRWLQSCCGLGKETFQSVNPKDYSLKQVDLKLVPPFTLPAQDLLLWALHKGLNL